MSDDAQTIQAALQIIELSGRFVLCVGGLAKNVGLPAMVKGAKGLGQVLQVLDAALYGQLFEKNTLARLIEKKGGDLVFFEVGSEDKNTLKDIIKQMKAYKITFARLPDLCGGDGRTQFAFSPQDAVRFRMFLRNHYKDRERNPELPEVALISAEDYAETGYDKNDKPTKELSDLMKNAEKEIRKEKEAQEKEAGKKGKKSKTPVQNPESQGKTVSGEKFFQTYESQSGPGFVKRIDGGNFIKFTKDGHALVDVPEMPGKCLLIEQGSIIKHGYLQNKGAEDNCLFVKFHDNQKYLLLDKRTGKDSYLPNNVMRAFWKMGSLRRKKRELEDRARSLGRKRITAKAEYAKEMPGNIGEVVSKTAKIRKKA